MDNVIQFNPRQSTRKKQVRKSVESSENSSHARWSHPMDPELKCYIKNQLASEIKALLLHRVPIYLDVSGIDENRRNWVIGENCTKVLRACFDQIKEL